MFWEHKDRKYMKYALVDDFGAFEWPRASDLKELVIGSRAWRAILRSLS